MLTDQVGSVRMVVDTSDGSVVQEIEYDSFGRVLYEQTTPGFSQPFRFAGGLHDPTTGLLRFGARDYDPELGRWASKDPILFAGRQANLYAYVNNDPINWIDPSGQAIPWVGAVVGAVIGGVGGALGAIANGQDAARSALVGAATGAAIGSGAALFSALGVGVSGKVLLGAYGGAKAGFAANAGAQALFTGSIDPSQLARSSALGATGGACSAAAASSMAAAGYASSISTSFATEFGVGNLMMSIEVGWSSLTNP